jgi:hypothetical protein
MENDLREREREDKRKDSTENNRNSFRKTYRDVSPNSPSWPTPTQQTPAPARIFKQAQATNQTKP